MFDYPTLRVLWWVLMGVLLIGFAIMDGFDLGAAALLTSVAKNDKERRIVINCVGPVWEGNQVWFILGGGAFFAAWPYLYAVSFSGFYIAMFLVLLTFIMRPVGFKYRSKMPGARWRNNWDWILCVAAILVSLVFGIAVGNAIQGVPFYFDNDLRAFYTGSFWGLFQPFPILCGLVSLFMILMHGGLYLAVKTEGAIRDRCIRLARRFAVLMILFFIIGGIWVANGVSGYVLTKMAGYAAPSNPLAKQVIHQTGAWMSNYNTNPAWLLMPLIGIVGALFAIFLARVRTGKLAFVCSALSLFGVIATVGVTMFPFILPSSSNPGSSLMVWDSSASDLSLTIMTWATILFLPIVLLYTAWVFRVMRGKVTEKFIDSTDVDAY